MFTKKETDFCKGIAIVLMLFHHLFNDFEEYAGYIVDYRPFTPDRLTFLALLSKVCVAIFVFLSGYGIAAVYQKTFGDREPEKKEIVIFSWNRYWKLMSGYWFVFVLVLLCQPLGRTIVDAYGTSMKEIILYFIIDFLGLSYLFSTPTLNPTWWYMTLAIFIIFVMPFIMYLTRKYGEITVLVVMNGSIYLLGTVNSSTFYLFSLLLGAVCMETGFFQRLTQITNKNNILKWIAFVAEIFVLFVLLSYRTNYNLNGIVDGLLALTIACMVHTMLIHIPVISTAFGFIGKYSLNIFLFHTLLYSYYFLDFFFSFRYWFLIVLMLLVVSLLISVGIEYVKEKSGYMNIMKRVSGIVISKTMH